MDSSVADENNNNQGVHVCHKCGWPFPKLHPSSKHRRAHKRICGTIQGYPVSDDAQICETPSPEADKRSIAGVGERSYRSEDEVFADAVAEFSDSGMSPASEERQLEDVKELEKNVSMTVVDDDVFSTGTLKLDDVCDSVKPMSSQPAHNIAPSTGLAESSPSGKDEAELSNNGLFLLSAPVENTEVVVDAVQNKGYLTQDTIDGSSSRLSEIHGMNGEEKEATHVQAVFSDLPIVEDADIMLKDVENQKLLKSEIPLVLGSVTVDRTLTKDNKNMPESQSIEPGRYLTELESQSTEHELSHLSGRAKQEASAVTVLIGEVVTQDEKSGTHCDSVEVCNSNREPEENMHVLSVASDLPIVNHADLMLQDFKDHRIVKSRFPLGENVIRSLEGDNELMVMEGPLNLHSVNLDGAAGNSVGNMNDVEEDMITIEGPDKGLADSLKSSVTTCKSFESEDLEVPPSTSGSEKGNIQPNCSLQGVEPDYEARNTECTENDGSSILTDHIKRDEVCQMTILSDDNKNKNAMALAEEVNTEGNDNSAVTRKEHSAEANIILFHGDDKQAIKLGQNNEGELVDITMNLSDEAWIEDNTEAATVEKFPTPTMAILEPEQELLSSNHSASVQDTPLSSIKTSVAATIMPAHPSSRKLSHNDFQDVTEAPELNSENENSIFVNYVDGGIVDYDSQGGDVEVEEVNSKRTIRKESETLPIHYKTSHESLPDIKTRNEIDSKSEITQESNVKLIGQPGGASAINLSVDLSSQTESVEGNWGLVSACRAQSDEPAAGTDVQPKTDPEGPDKLEGTKLQQEIASERPDLHKADIYEPPSFLTLVEPRGGSDQGNVTFEIEKVQASQQPKTEVLQAGWLPLLSNIANESSGRKKNEEMIAKVTNWSAAKQHSIPLKNLLGEAKVETRTKSPSPKQTKSNIQIDATVAKSNVCSTTTVKEVLGSEVSASDRTVRGVTAEEWNSPARYSVEIKKVKKKSNGKPFWVPFACCSSVN
ncbi:uncharacterized protein LOC108209769 [Daucus carota subsp. sativus]|uniref:uncharacterized protein LOC108209769 n=1 Tax=Daucus carota subsp. sativus TaxID=79200 RepID=UPI0007EFB817|nr:PREDICTED: uncharacterized protein LOC108209769 isoform X1 [Daucus carota subsp. sativus]